MERTLVIWQWRAVELAFFFPFYRIILSTVDAYERVKPFYSEAILS